MKVSLLFFSLIVVAFGRHLVVFHHDTQHVGFAPEAPLTHSYFPHVDLRVQFRTVVDGTERTISLALMTPEEKENFLDEDCEVLFSRQVPAESRDTKLVLFRPDNYREKMGQDWLASHLTGHFGGESDQIEILSSSPHFALLRVEGKEDPFFSRLSLSASTHGVVVQTLRETKLFRVPSKEEWAEKYGFSFFPTNNTKTKFLFGYDQEVAKVVSQVDGQRLFKNVDFLSNQFFTRISSSGEAVRASYALADYLRGLGYSPVIEYFKTNFSANVFAFLEGQLNQSVVVVSGHYDCRQVDMYDPSQRAPGADDNASAASMVMEIARVLAAYGKKPKYSVHFLLSSGEEQFLYGARDYAQKLRRLGFEVVADVNADMISYLPAGEPMQVAVIANHATSWLNQVSLNISSLYLPSGVKLGYSPGCCSDQQAFVEEGYPGISFFERVDKIYRDNPYYHTVKDAIGFGSNSPNTTLNVVRAAMATTVTLAF